MSHAEHQGDLETNQNSETAATSNGNFSQTNTQGNYSQVPSDHSNCESHPQSQPHKHRGMNQNQQNFIVAFTVFMPINVLIMEYFWLTEPIKENEFEYHFSLYSLYFFFSFSMIAYYFAIKIKNTVPDKQPPEADQYFLPEIYKNNKRCDGGCTKWKPMRAHHCRQCGVCSVRMDHHCPWTVNCVGARNHKAFYLFCIYMGLGSSQYCYRTIYFFITESDNNTLSNYSTLFYIYWGLTSIVLFPIAMMLVSLMIFHSCAAFANVTTLENMAGTSVNCCTNGFNDQYFSRTTNLYDRGFFANYANFLGNSLFFFWVPSPVYPDKDGTEFPMNPPLTFGEMIKSSGKIEIFVSEDYYEDKRKIMQDYSTKAEIECKDKNLQIAGKIFQYYKKFEVKTMTNENNTNYN